MAKVKARQPVIGGDLDRLEYDGEDLFWDGKKLKMEIGAVAKFWAFLIALSSLVAAGATLAQAIYVWTQP